MPETRGRRRALIATLAVGVPVAVLLVWPQLFGAEDAPGVAQVIAFRSAAAIGFGVLAVLAVVVARLARRRAVVSGIAVGLAIVLAAASIGNAAVQLVRGTGGSAADGDLTVVVWNTLGGGASAASIARLVLETDADIVSLPETSDDTAAEVIRLLADSGKAMSADTADGEVPTSVLIGEDLGAYRRDPDAGSTPVVPSGVWRPVDAGSSAPVIVAAHPVPPLPVWMSEWRTGMEWATALCDEPGVIVAGDLNATVDHLAHRLGGCRDASAEAGVSSVGTWPTMAPAWLGAPIDHVLVGDGWTVDGAEVLVSFDDAGSDHRPLRVELTPRQDGPEG